MRIVRVFCILVVLCLGQNSAKAIANSVRLVPDRASLPVPDRASLPVSHRASLPVAYPAADSASLKGVVLDEQARPLVGASLLVPGLGLGTTSDERGRFALRVPAVVQVTLEIRFLGYRTEQRTLRLRVGELLPMRIQLEPASITLDKGITVEADRDRSMGVAKIDPLVSRRIANPSGNFETVLQAFGARSQQEFSSQFQVRGGITTRT